MEQDLRYPIGKHTKPENISPADIERFIKTIEQLPAKMRAAVKDLDDAQLDTPYRDGGWTVRQVVHHVADSHVNAYIRFKFALTEDNPTIKPYTESDWAELPEAKTADPEISLRFLEALHARWVLMLNAIDSTQWSRTYIHPQYNRTSRLDEVLALYAWHSEHHVAHIKSIWK